MSNHNPLRREFWLGGFDPRPLALFRIGLGLVVLHDLVDLAPNFVAFLTDDGVLPRSVPRDGYAWSLFDLVGSRGGVAALFAVGFLAVTAFTLGLWTRVATVVSWVWIVSLHNRNYFVTDGGDQLVGALFFWSTFADLAGCWSLDSRRRGGPLASVPAFGLRLLQLQLVLLYYATARLKLAKGWLHGTVVFQALQLEGLVRPFGAWMGAHPALCTVSTYSILAMEIAFPILAMAPFAIIPMRAVALAFGLMIQMGIFLTMRVGIFQEAMLSTCALFVLPEWLDRVQVWLGKAPLPPPQPPPESATIPAWRLALYSLLAFQSFTVAWVFVGERRFPMPSFVATERKLLAIELQADLFGTVYNIPHWSAPGVLSDGSPSEDVLSAVAPDASPHGPGLSFSRWSKFAFKEREHPLPWPTLGRYLCRRYDERPMSGRGVRLTSFDVVNDEERPRLPGEDPHPPKRRLLWHQECQ